MRLKKKIKRNIALLFLMGFLITGILYYHNMSWQLRDRWMEVYYDWRESNPIVTSQKQIDQIFDNFEQITYKHLAKDYLDETLSDDPRFKYMLEKQNYYVIPQSELNRYIVGHYRIKNFIAKDDYYIDCIMGNRPNVIWLINKKVIYKTLELIKELQIAGYNPYGFVVTSAHRPPSYNEKIKGANKSRHIAGEAVDITVYDINNDGVSNREDKKIVLDLLDKKIIKDLGGVGLYPGTQALHYDVRGRKARWNSFKR